MVVLKYNFLNTAEIKNMDEISKEFILFLIMNFQCIQMHSD